MKYCDFSEAKVGDKVWSIRHGWVKILNVHHSESYPILINKGKEEIDTLSFTINGKLNGSDLYPILFWNEFEIPEIAFRKPIPKLEVDTLVWVWDKCESLKFLRFFSHFDEYGSIYTFDDGRDSSYNLDATTDWNYWELYEPKNKD